MMATIKTLTAGLMIISALLLGAGCDRTETQAQPQAAVNGQRLVQVSVVTVAPTPMKDILVLPGVTEAWQDVRVSADTSGQVEWIGPREGDAVKTGDLLAKIDVSALKVALDRAQAAYKLADELYQRRQQLFERKIITQEELDRSITERTLAHSNLRQAQVEHDRGFLRSPIDGVVNHLFVDAGEFVDRGHALADLVNIDKIKTNVNVPELDIRYLTTGQKVALRVDAFPQKEISGVVDFVAFKADPATNTFLVRILMENAAHAVRPGMMARVAFLRRLIPDALAAPLFALVDKGGERLLFVEKNGVVEARTVSLGIIDGDRIQITRGLEPGDRLIVTGQKEVEEGMRVVVK
jgi:membrane fusion protein (multidrug efflux system)